MKAIDKFDNLFDEIKEVLKEDLIQITENLSEEVTALMVSSILEIALVKVNRTFYLDVCFNLELVPSDIAFFMELINENFSEEIKKGRVQIHNFIEEKGDRIYGEEGIKTYFDRLNESNSNPKKYLLDALSQPIIPEHIGYYSSHNDEQYDISTKLPLIQSTELNDNPNEGLINPNVTPMISFDQFFLKFT